MFKKLLIPVCFIAFFTSCDVRKKDQQAVNGKDVLKQEPVKDPATVQLIDSVFDFGKITEGENVEFSFRFKNAGSNPLVITNASASCGCTVPEKPEAPVMPGETGFIKVKFNSQGRPGQTHKTVTVLSNAVPDFPVLQLKGEVLPKTAEQ